MRTFFSQFAEATPVALESVGHWYSRKDTGTVWIADEMEGADWIPLPAHAAEAKRFASYCALVPKLSASAGKAHYGSMVKQCNTYRKWAFIEAANVFVAHRHQGGWRTKYVVHPFELTRRRKGHAAAVGATARYLAESTYWVLKKKQPYREPPDSHPAETEPPGSLSHGQARA